MSTLLPHIEKVRSKNAGPFWLTIDIFCTTTNGFHLVKKALATVDIAGLLGTPTEHVKRFDLENLNVIKISIPRPAIQGTIEDRDMHGAATAVLIEEWLAIQ